MWVDGICFSYEWLLHIGASTKTADSVNNAGYFGKGFKIASLCALRDYGWNIVMSSGNWRLSVMDIDEKIDKSIVKMLAYEVKEQKQENRSCLLLSEKTEEEYCLFKNVTAAFYYSEKSVWLGYMFTSL